MARPIVNPINDHRDHATHPAWVLIGASRMSHSPPGAVLFDSDVRHQHYVVIKLVEASRERHLSRDWIHGRQAIVEVALSEAQWASFVSSMNVGDGVPATLLWRESLDDPRIPGMPYEPRLKESMAEVHNAGVAAQASVLEAFTQYSESKTKENLTSLKHAIENMPANMDFAAQSLSEHAENVVQRARADIGAFVTAKAKQLGIDPADIGGMPELGDGS
jgi:hypothetical protein